MSSGQVIPDAFLVRDADAVNEIAEHGAILFKQPGANEIAGHQIERGPREGCDHGGVALGAGLALEEDRPNLARFGNGFDGGVVKRFVGFVSIGQKFKRQVRRHETEEFMRGEHRNKNWSYGATERW